MKANGAAGKFVWYDQMSNDLKASEAFYKTVIGWSVDANTMNASEYSILKAGDAMIGGLMPIPEDFRRAGVRPAWMGYIGVEDVDVYASKVKAAGGAIHREPSDIPNVGRFALAADPTGAGFILFKGQAKPRRRPTRPSRAILVGASCTRPTARRRSISTLACSAGAEATPWIWGPKAFTGSSRSTARWPAAS